MNKLEELKAKVAAAEALHEATCANNEYAYSCDQAYEHYYASVVAAANAHQAAQAELELYENGELERLQMKYIETSGVFAEMSYLSVKYGPEQIKGIHIKSAFSEFVVAKEELEVYQGTVGGNITKR